METLARVRGVSKTPTKASASWTVPKKYVESDPGGGVRSIGAIECVSWRSDREKRVTSLAK